MIVEYEGKRMRPRELAQVLEHARPVCRACGNETSVGKNICPMCSPGYELARKELDEAHGKLMRIAAVVKHWANEDGPSSFEALETIGAALGEPF